jgi:hypothetical protein
MIFEGFEKKIDLGIPILLWRHYGINVNGIGSFISRLSLFMSRSINEMLSSESFDYIRHSDIREFLLVMSYVFVGAGFPMHRDLIWSIVPPL